MSSLEQRRQSPRRRQQPPEWPVAVFVVGFWLTFAVVLWGGIAIMQRLAPPPSPCVKIGGAIAIAGDCR